jgi:ABC-type branched-subunit amino acid transport system ATPase component
VPDLRLTTLRRGERREGAAPLLRIEHLSVKVGIRRVIEDLNLEMFEGDAICISGPNGSGKTTLLNAVAGLDPARVEAGAISLGGEDMTSLPPHERSRRGIAFMRQRENVFVDLTVDENLRLAAGPDGPAQFREILPSWTSDIPGRKRVGLLSGGQKQWLAWAMANLRPSRLLLADEPEAGVSDGAMSSTSRSSRMGSSFFPSNIAASKTARVEAGTISLGGEDVTGLSPLERSRHGLAFMRSGENVLEHLTVDDNLRLAAGPDGPARFRETFPSWTSDIPGRKLAGLLSEEQKNRFALAVATLRQRGLRLADDPRAGVSAGAMLSTARVGTLLLVSHDPGRLGWMAPC